jgi:diaminopropionate ammonia-lyase
MLIRMHKQAGRGTAPLVDLRGPGAGLRLNSGARDWFAGADQAATVGFHDRLPGYAVTPLRELPGLTRRLDLGALLVKDESRRLGLPAFKILGASWGVYRALCDRLPAVPEWDDIGALRAQLQPLRQLQLLTATAGNHGRAVARMGRWLGLPTLVMVPSSLEPATVDDIAGEGAEIRTVPGTYDDAVQVARDEAARDERFVLVQDTAWPGYEQVPGWIVEGYDRLLREVDDQVAALGRGHPDLVVVPVGVGSLLAAAIRHYRAPGRSTAVLSVEAEGAACVLASLRAGEPVAVPTGPTVMQALNAGTMSMTVWPLIRDGLDAAVAVTDAAAIDAGALLHSGGVEAGPCGAGALAGAIEALSGQHGSTVRDRLGLGPSSTVVVLSTDGRRPPRSGGPA